MRRNSTTKPGLKNLETAQNKKKSILESTNIRIF